MKNIVSTKKSSSVFLAIVLVLGTFTVSSSSFMLGNVQAQPNYGMDNSYDKKLYGNSYEQDYGMDNRYDSYEPDHYGRDNDYDKKSYGYESEYPSYGKDDKSTDSKSVSINKIKCINTNLNINGNNAGNVSIGNKGQGYVDAYSSDGGNLYGGGEGYSKQDKGFDCIINNNNNNTNLISNGGGNATNGNVTEPQNCEECFRAFLNGTQISAYLAIFSPNTPITLEQFCETVESGFAIVETQFRLNLATVGVSQANINALIACLENVGIEFS